MVNEEGEGCACVFIDCARRVEEDLVVATERDATAFLCLLRCPVDGAEAAVVWEENEAHGLVVQLVARELAVSVDLGVEARRSGDSLVTLPCFSWPSFADGSFSFMRIGLQRGFG
jgi:hypothetical protein